MIELDQIDKKAASVLDGYLVRKDLVRTFSRQFPVPTYVVEFMLGRYCASTDQDEIDEGLEIVQRQLKSRTVRAGEEELFKAKALETGEVKIIDLVTARVDNTVQHFPVVVVQQLLQVVTALERLTRCGDARLKVVAVVGAADLGSHWRSSRLAGCGHAGQGRPAHGFRYLATSCLQDRRETASRVKAQAIHEQHALALGGGEGLGAGDCSAGVVRSIDQLLQVARRLLQPG